MRRCNGESHTQIRQRRPAKQQQNSECAVLDFMLNRREKAHSTTCQIPQNRPPCSSRGDILPLSVEFEESSPLLGYALALVVLYPPLESLPHALAFPVHFHAMLSCVPVALIGRAAMSFAACSRAGVTTWCTT